MITHPPTTRLLDVEYRSIPIDTAQRPRLYVVVDTEAEFDWHRPFARDLTRVASIAAQEQAQRILRRHGVRPVYVVDYPVASQPEGWRPLRAIMERGDCEIGAHLHPWTNPPFDEAVSTFNSYPGNLAAAVEARKLERLIAAIHGGFGIAPRFYKAGRYGIGPHTIGLIARHGIGVDFSILPGADLSARGGPDFRQMRSTPYVAVAGPGARVVSVPMTRGHVGMLAGWETRLTHPLGTRAARLLHMRGVLDETRLLRQATLTPEGFSLSRQIALVRRMTAHGQRIFVMHYHSPSLVPGHTPYVRSSADLTALLGRIEGLCRYFFGPLGGVPGNPADLLMLAGPGRANKAA